MTSGIELHLLGPMRVVAAGREIELPARKARGLLAYLAHRQGVAVPRETICGLFWGDRGGEQARASLRQTLSAIRKALGDGAADAISASQESITLMSAGVWTDARALEAAGNAASADELVSAATLYRGDLLEGFNLGEAGFDEWLSGERQRMRVLVTQALFRLVAELENQGRTEEALAHGARLVALDPLQERAHRALMRLYASQGRHDAALAQFEQCRKRLAEELGVQPEKETLDLAAEVRERRRRSAGVGKPQAPEPPSRPAAEAVAEPPAPPAKPSIAVLPFVNLSGDPEQEHFADGVAEDLITQLSRLRDLMVIGRSSTSVFKGQAVPVSEVARQLGVRYVLEGSVRRSGNRLRVAAQLVDAATGGHVWAERYDREVTDLFDLQDEITKAVTVALQIKLTEGDAARITAEGTRDLRAWELYLEGESAFHTWTKPDNLWARRCFEEAVAEDPGFGHALVKLALTHWIDARFRYTSDPAASIEIAEDILARAQDVTGETGRLLAVKGMIYLMEWRHDEAVALQSRSVEMAPSDTYCVAPFGMTQLYAGDLQGALASLKAALRLSPLAPNFVAYYLTYTHLWLDELDKARAAAATYLAREPQEPYAYLVSAIAEAASGRMQAARGHIATLLAKQPDITCDDFAHAQYYRDPQRLERLVSWLKDAGLPEGRSLPQGGV